MNKRLNRILRPGMGAYFIIMGVFCCATLLFEYYWLAAVECGVTLLTLALYLMDRRRSGRCGRACGQALEAMKPGAPAGLGDSGFAGLHQVGHGGGDEHGGECTGDYTEQHCEDERADGVATEDEDADEHEEG